MDVGWQAGCRPQPSSSDLPTLNEEQPADVVDEVHQLDLRRRTGGADRSDEEADPRLLIGEDVFDPAADLRFGVVRPPRFLRHRPSLRLLAMDPADEAVVGHEGLVDGGAIGRIGPHRPRRVGGVEQAAAQHRALVGGRVRDLPCPDEAVTASMATWFW